MKEKNYYSNKLVGFFLIYILIYQIDSLKDIFKKSILLFSTSINSADSKIIFISFVAKLCYYVSILGTLIIITMWLLIICFNFYYDKKRNKNIKNLNTFETSLNEYLNNKKNKRTYLIKGDWGSGKTFIINDFFEKYYKHSNIKIYRISCFGIETREQIISELKNQVIKQDNSFLKVINSLPVIGKPVYSILNKPFNLSNIKKNSIFIFDDFERITLLGMNNVEKYYSRPYYKAKKIKGPFRGKPQEFLEIENEFNKIEKGFRINQNDEKNTYLLNNIQKYNIVIGLINELVDKYEKKVIIICNTNFLDNEYIDLIFRDKLECITYNKKVDEISIKNMFSEVFRNQVMDKNIRDILTSTIEEISLDTVSVFREYGNTNLRTFKAIIQAFLDTIIYLKEENLTNIEFNISLFYSIYLTKIIYDNKDVSLISEFKIGGSLYIQSKLYGSSNNNNIYRFISAMKASKYSASLRWVGIRLSTSYIMNTIFPTTKEIIKDIKDYNDYKFYQIEEETIKSSDLDSEKLYNYDSLCYLYSINAECRENIANYINNCNFDALFNEKYENSKEEKLVNILREVEITGNINNDYSVTNAWNELIFGRLIIEYQGVNLPDEKLMPISDEFFHYSQFLEKKDNKK